MWVQVPSSAYLKVHPFGWIFFCIKGEYEFELDCFKVSDSFFVSICLDKYSVCNLNASTNISPEKKKFKKVVDFLESPLYTNKRAKEHEAHKKCRSGGIGRRAGFRCLWSQDRVGSSPISCIIFFLLLRIQELLIMLAV